MNNPDENQNLNYKKKLKKVKRPIRRLPPQSPLSEGMPGSPFSKAENKPGFVNNDFDKQPATTENLPSMQKWEPQQQTFLGEDDFDDFGADNGYVEQRPTQSSQEKKIMILVATLAFILGFIVAKFFFSEQKIVKDGLQGVVVNAEVPRGRARCGLAERTQGCVLYIMNPQKQELSARDFYDLAAQLTGRQRFVIETGNMRYSNTKIKSGEIGQFNIPPLTN